MDTRERIQSSERPHTCNRFYSRANRQRIHFLFFLLFILTNLSCQQILKATLRDPQVKVTSVQINDLDTLGIKMTIELEVINPNTISLRIDELSYELFIGTESIIKGATLEKTQLLPDKKTIINLPLKLDYRSTFAAFDLIAIKGISDYEVKGYAKSGFISYPYSKKGQFQR